MRTTRLIFGIVVVSLAACIDFDAARAQCDRPGGRCFTDAGASGGGTTSTGGGGTTSTGGGTTSTGGGTTSTGGGTTSTGGGTTSTGGGTTSTGGGTTSTGGGTTSTGGGTTSTGGGTTSTGGGTTSTGGGGGGCPGCYGASNCNPTPKDDDTNCGAPNVMCMDCGVSGMCRGYVCEAKRSWQKKGTDTHNKELKAVWVSPTGVVSAAGNSATLVRSEGTGFREAPLPTEVLGLTGATVAGNQSLVTTGPNASDRVACIMPFDWNGSQQRTFDQISDTTQLRGIWTAGSEVYVGGARPVATDAGVIARLTDAGWVEISIKPRYNEVLAGWGNANGYVFITDDPYYIRVPNAGAADTVVLPFAAKAVSGGNSSNVWVAGDSGFVGRLVGTALTHFDTAAFYSWAAIMPISDTRVFVAGSDGANAAIGEWDGVQWRITTFGPGAFRAMHGTSLSTLWAVDSNGSLWHFE